MALTIRTNVASANTQSSQAARQTQAAQRLAAQQQAFGSRKGSGADVDVSGLSMQNSQSTQATLRVNEDINRLQNIETNVGYSRASLSRMRELAVMSTSDSATSQDREGYQAEFGQLMDEVNRMLGSTGLNDQNILAGSADGGGQAGANIGDNAGLASEAGPPQITTRSGAENAIGVLDSAMGKLFRYDDELSASLMRLEDTLSGAMDGSGEVGNRGSSRIADASFAKEAAQMTKLQIRVQEGVSLLAQAKQRPQSALSLIG